MAMVMIALVAVGVFMVIAAVVGIGRKAKEDRSDI